MNKKTLTAVVLGIFAILLALGAYFLYFAKDEDDALVNNPSDSSITYQNTTYGFNFTLPSSWQGYTVVEGSWTGTPITKTPAQSGPKIIIRNPKWTAAAPYEDLPVLVFTLAQWSSYTSENFAVSAAPIQATKLDQNNKYVFALPARWDFDYSLGYKEAQAIFAGNPVHAFDVGVAQGKLNINVVCEQALSYMTFADSKSADLFVADCKEGKHPEVIEKYKVDMNLGDGATI